MVVRQIALSLTSLTGTYVNRNKRSIVTALLVLVVVAVAVHFGFLVAVAPFALGAVITQNAPPLPQGEVWVNKPGAVNDFVRTNIMDFDGMPSEDYFKYFGGGRRIKYAQDHTRWHARLWAPATTITASGQGYDFFQKMAGDSETSLDGGTNLVIDDYLTNMADAGRMEKGSTFIVHAIGIKCIVPHREFNAFTALEPVSAAVTVTDTSSATAHILALDRGAIFEFTRGSGTGRQHLAQGSLLDFPSQGKVGGIASGNTVEGYMSNGEGFVYPLREVIVLDEGRQFKLTMKTYRALLSVLNVEVRPILYGTLIRTV